VLAIIVLLLDVGVAITRVMGVPPPLTVVGVAAAPVPAADPAMMLVSPSTVVLYSAVVSSVVSLPDLLFFSFLMPGLAKCRSSRWRRRLRD